MPRSRTASAIGKRTTDDQRGLASDLGSASSPAASSRNAGTSSPSGSISHSVAHVTAPSDAARHLQLPTVDVAAMECEYPNPWNKFSPNSGSSDNNSNAVFTLLRKLFGIWNIDALLTDEYDDTVKDQLRRMMCEVVQGEASDVATLLARQVWDFLEGVIISLQRIKDNIMALEARDRDDVLALHDSINLDSKTLYHIGIIISKEGAGGSNAQINALLRAIVEIELDKFQEEDQGWRISLKGRAHIFQQLTNKMDVNLSNFYNDTFPKLVKDFIRVHFQWPKKSKGTTRANEVLTMSVDALTPPLQSSLPQSSQPPATTSTSKKTKTQKRLEAHRRHIIKKTPKVPNTAAKKKETETTWTFLRIKVKAGQPERFYKNDRHSNILSYDQYLRRTHVIKQACANGDDVPNALKNARTKQQQEDPDLKDDPTFRPVRELRKGNTAKLKGKQQVRTSEVSRIKGLIAPLITPPSSITHVPFVDDDDDDDDDDDNNNDAPTTTDAAAATAKEKDEKEEELARQALEIIEIMKLEVSPHVFNLNNFKHRLHWAESLARIQPRLNDSKHPAIDVCPRASGFKVKKLHLDNDVLPSVAAAIIARFESEKRAIASQRPFEWSQFDHPVDPIVAAMNEVLVKLKKIGGEEQTWPLIRIKVKAGQPERFYKNGRYSNILSYDQYLRRTHVIKQACANGEDVPNALKNARTKQQQEDPDLNDDPTFQTIHELSQLNAKRIKEKENVTDPVEDIDGWEQLFNIPKLLNNNNINNNTTQDAAASNTVTKKQLHFHNFVTTDGCTFHALVGRNEKSKDGGAFQKRARAAAAASTDTTTTTTSAPNRRFNKVTCLAREQATKVQAAHELVQRVIPEFKAEAEAEGRPLHGIFKFVPGDPGAGAWDLMSFFYDFDENELIDMQLHPPRRPLQEEGETAEEYKERLQLYYRDKKAHRAATTNNLTVSGGRFHFSRAEMDVASGAFDNRRRREHDARMVEKQDETTRKQDPQWIVDNLQHHRGDLDVRISNMAVRFKHAPELAKRRATDGSANREFRQFTGERSVIDKVINCILEGPDGKPMPKDRVFVIMGNGYGPNQKKGWKERPCFKLFERKLSQRCNLLMVDEYRTSKMCSFCKEGEMKGIVASTVISKDAKQRRQWKVEQARARYDVYKLKRNQGELNQRAQSKKKQLHRWDPKSKRYKAPNLPKTSTTTPAPALPPPQQSSSQHSETTAETTAEDAAASAEPAASPPGSVEPQKQNHKLHRIVECTNCKWRGNRDFNACHNIFQIGLAIIRNRSAKYRPTHLCMTEEDREKRDQLAKKRQERYTLVKQLRENRRQQVDVAVGGSTR